VERVPGPVFVEVPANLYILTHDIDLDAERAAFDDTATPAGAPVAGGRPPAPDRAAVDGADLDRAAALLAAAKRPLIYAGLGALPAAAVLVELAELLEAPVATTFQGKGVFPERHPLFLWPGFGAAAPAFARTIAADCDAVLAIGCRFGEVATGSYGLTMPGPLVHIDIDPAVPGRNYPADVAIAADSAVAVPALLERLRRGTPANAARRSPADAEPHGRSRDGELRRRIAAGHAGVEAEWHEAASPERVTPFALLRAIQARFGPDTVFTTDSGNGTFLAMEILRLDGPQRFLAPVDYSCMGYSVPAAVGAKLAAPDRPVVALAGDGAFLMTGLELLTAAHYSVPVAIFVLRDRELAQIAQFQHTALNRKTASGVHDYEVAGLGAAFAGVETVRLDADEGIDAALDAVHGALAAGRPVLVDVAIDYSHRTHFTRGVVRTNLGRLPWRDRLRFIGRAVGRRVFAGGQPPAGGRKGWPGAEPQ
jgi:acetolactate synthase I/II/III large subunit